VLGGESQFFHKLIDDFSWIHKGSLISSRISIRGGRVCLTGSSSFVFPYLL
ncbi:unnamed protein product, partial [Acidithrix sp. C25]